jgi:hypothetical protein
MRNLVAENRAGRLLAKLRRVLTVPYDVRAQASLTCGG